MTRPRIIPCLLLGSNGLVKTQKFRKRTYVGDPVNTLSIFNDKGVDEIVVLDIDASRYGRRPDFGRIEELTSQCFMPMAYGGGIATVEDVGRIIGLGVEKVVINSRAIADPDLIGKAAGVFGSQSIMASIDVGTGLFRRQSVRTHGGNQTEKRKAVDIVRNLVDAGAGEVLIQSIDRDGTMLGYDLDLVREITGAVSVPVIACGGAGSIGDLVTVIRDAGASAAAAGSLFVFYGRRRAVLISYPSATEIDAIQA